MQNAFYFSQFKKSECVKEFK